MSEHYEVAIIGGGIAGLGTAVELAGRGAQVALFEKGHCGAATSAGSLKIMHGGMRYLQKLDFRRVFQSVRAQAALLRDFPNLVRPLHCVLALESHGLRSRIPMSIAALLYRGCCLMAHRSLRDSKPLPPPTIVTTCALPEVVQTFLHPHGLFSWWDAQLTSHQALVDSLLATLNERAVTLFAGHAIDTLTLNSKGFSLRDQSGAEYQADSVIDLSGRAVGALHPSRPFADVAWSRAFNVVLDAPMPTGQAIAFNGKGGSSFFLVGRGSECALGTAYLPCNGIWPIVVAQNEVDSFLVEARQARPELAILGRPVARLELGSIPVKSWGKKGPCFYGMDRLYVEGRYVAALVNKYTTFRSLATRIGTIYSQQRFRSNQA